MVKKQTHLRNRLDLYDPSTAQNFFSWLWSLEKYFRFEVKGVKNLPPKKGALVVMNHGIIPYHGLLFGKSLLQDYNIPLRFLGAGFLFDIPYIKGLAVKIGVVNANPKNAKKLLQQKNYVLVAPGGIYEALIAKQGLKRIPWERRVGFVKTAMDANVPIVPTYCQGINSVYINSYLFLKARIKILEKIRFSMPFFYGLGLLPFPIKLTHVIGKPISSQKRKNETTRQAINRIHQNVIDEMIKLAKVHS